MSEDEDIFPAQDFPATLEEQIAYFHRLAVRPPEPNDPMDMVGFGATLLLGRLTVLKLKADFEKARNDSCGSDEKRGI